MIIDVHTHTPSHYKTVDQEAEEYDTKMRPDRPIKMTNSVNEYLQDMAPVNVAIVFGIARHPSKNDALEHLNFVDDVNDSTAKIVSLGSGKLIGFMSVHPDSRSLADGDIIIFTIKRTTGVTNNSSLYYDFNTFMEVEK